LKRTKIKRKGKRESRKRGRGGRKKKRRRRGKRKERVRRVNYTPSLLSPSFLPPSFPLFSYSVPRHYSLCFDEGIGECPRDKVIEDKVEEKRKKEE